MKVIVERLGIFSLNGNDMKCNAIAYYYDGNGALDAQTIEVDFDENTNTVVFHDLVEAAIIQRSIDLSYSVSVSDIIWGGLPLINTPLAISESSMSLSVQTSTGAVGVQVDTARDSFVMVNAGVTTTATIGGVATGDMVVEVAPTNSATSGDWVEKGRVSNSQSISLAIVLQSVQVVKGMLVAFVPKGYYVKIRSITGSGSPTYAISSARKALM